MFIQCGCCEELCSPHEGAKLQPSTSTGAGVWRRAPGASDSSSVLDKFQAASRSWLQELVCVDFSLSHALILKKGGHVKQTCTYLKLASAQVPCTLHMYHQMPVLQSNENTT